MRSEVVALVREGRFDEALAAAKKAEHIAVLSTLMTFDRPAKLATVANFAGVSRSSVRAILNEAVEAGHVVQLGERFWSLTEAGAEAVVHA